jgi:Flp pilus assembly protein TadG
MRRLFRQIAVDQQGATIVEFALITPALLLTLMGLFDMAHNMYTAQMLNGAIQQAARNSTIEGAQSREAALDAIVANAVKAISPGATAQFSRTAYRDFTSVGRPEDWSDVNSDGTCNTGEPFEDANGNGTWDRSPGTAGFGGARDAVLYTVTIEYPRLFPIARLIPGQSELMRMQSATVLRNQPFGAADTSAPAVGNCT